MNLTEVSTKELRAEVARRDAIDEAANEKAQREWIDKEYGHCEHEDWDTGKCGEEFRGFDAREVRPILSAPPDYPALLGYCPPEMCWQIGGEWEIKLTCRNGHDTFREKTQLFKEPLKPLFH